MKKNKLITKLLWAISLFFWKLTRITMGNHTIVGIPYQRDPENPCDVYEPFKYRGKLIFHDCESDGHYLCRKCVHLKEPEDLS